MPKKNKDAIFLLINQPPMAMEAATMNQLNTNLLGETRVLQTKAAWNSFYIALSAQCLFFINVSFSLLFYLFSLCVCVCVGGGVMSHHM